MTGRSSAQLHNQLPVPLDCPHDHADDPRRAAASGVELLSCRAMQAVPLDRGLHMPLLVYETPPILQTAYKQIACQSVGAEAPGRDTRAVASIPLLILPDNVVEETAQHLSVSSLASLQATCKHLNLILQHDR